MTCRGAGLLNGRWVALRLAEQNQCAARSRPIHTRSGWRCAMSRCSSHTLCASRKRRRKVLVVLAQLGEHFQGSTYARRSSSVRASDTAVTSACSADLADALRNGVRHRIELIGLFVHSKW